MKRRTFIGLLSGAVGWPIAVRARQKPLPLVGCFSSTSPEAAPGIWLSGLKQGLADGGFTEGRNIALEYRWARGDYGRLPQLAGELVAETPAAIFCASFPPALAAKAATSTIPIVFTVGVDPVTTGLVTSLAHPGGNLTGIAELIGELLSKRLQLLHELVPNAALIGALVNPSHPDAEHDRQVLLEAAKFLGFELFIFTASSAGAFEEVFAQIANKPIGALLVSNDAMFFGETKRLTALAAHYRIPAIYVDRTFTVAGGLMSYGSDNQNNARQAGDYIGRILKGAKPADLPVQQPTKIDLIINLKTANALGLTVPQSLLQRADEVIE